MHLKAVRILPDHTDVEVIMSRGNDHFVMSRSLAIVSGEIDHDAEMSRCLDKLIELIHARVERDFRLGSVLAPGHRREEKQ